MIQNNKKNEFLSILLGTLSTSFLGNLLASKGVITVGQETIKV